MRTSATRSVGQGEAALGEQTRPPTVGEVRQLLSQAHDESSCATAALALLARVRAEPRPGLLELLGALPAEVAFAPVCAAVISQVARGPDQGNHWPGVFAAIRRASEATFKTIETPQALALLQACAQALARSCMADTALWDDLLQSVPVDVDPAPERLPAIAALGRQMECVGVESAPLWRLLVQAACSMSPNSTAQLPRVPLADIARALKAAPIQSLAPWSVMLAIADSLPIAQGGGSSVMELVAASLFGEPLDESRFRQIVQHLGFSNLVGGMTAAKVQDSKLWILAIDAACRPAGSQSSAMYEVVQAITYGHASRDTAVIRTLLEAVAGQPQLLESVICGLSVGGLDDPAHWVMLLRAAHRAPPADKGHGLFLINGQFDDGADQGIFRRPGADTLREALLELTLGPGTTPCAAFLSIGVRNACNLLLNLDASEKGAPNRPVPTQYGRVYEAMLRNAVSGGRLGLASIADIAQHRARLRQLAPTILWDMVFDPVSHLAPTASFCSYPALKLAAQGFMGCIKSLGRQAAAYNHKLYQEGVPLDVPDRLKISGLLDPTLKLLVQHMCCQEDKYFSKLMDKVWGPQGERDVTVDAGLLSRLISAGGAAQAATFSPSVVKAMHTMEAQLREWADQTHELSAPAQALLAQWEVMKALVATPDFKAGYDNYVDYSLSLLDLDDAANLVLGREVNCCLAPTASNFFGMIQRLAGAWISPVVKDGHGKPVAVAWCTLNEQGELVVDFVDIKLTHSAPPGGHLIAEQLVAFVPQVAAAINAPLAPWLGEPLYDKLSDVPVFTSKTYVELTMDMLEPQLLGIAQYADHIDGSPGNYAKLV